MSRPTSTFAIAAALCVAACSTGNDVGTETSSEIRTPTLTSPEPEPEQSEPDSAETTEDGPVADDDAPAAPATTTTSAPVTDPPVTDPPVAVDPPPLDALIFDLERFDVAVNLAPTTLTDPDEVNLASGFLGATMLPNGTLVAHGYVVPIDATGETANAVWQSVDGQAWARSSTAPTGAAGLQFISTLRTDATGRAVAVVAGLEPGDQSTGPSVDFGLAVSWSSDDGLAWGSDALVGNTSVLGGDLVGGGLVLTGAASPNSEAFTAAVYTEPTDAEPWPEILLEPDGASSVATDIIDVGASRIAVGGSARTDPIASVETTYAEMVDNLGPLDVAIWRSDGDNDWAPIDTDAFTGKSGPALARSIVEVDGRLYVLISNILGYQTVLDVYASDDLGDTWEFVRIPRALSNGVGNSTELSTVGLYSVGDALIVVEGRAGFDGQQLFMTVADPVNGDGVTHELSDELGIVSLDQILPLDTSSLGFGTARGESDQIQTIEIRWVDGGSGSPEDSEIESSDA